MRNAFIVLAIVFVAPVCSAQGLGTLKVPDLSSYDVSISANADATAEPEGQPSGNRTLFRVSQLALIGAAALDDATTWWNMTHPKVVSYCLQGGPASCTQGVSTIVTFSEAGWTSWFVDNKSPTKTLVLSGAAYTAVFFAIRALYKHGHQRIATGMNFVLAGARLDGGIYNLRSRAGSAQGLVPTGAFNVVQ